MSYSQFLAAAKKVEEKEDELRQAQAELGAALPFLGDDIFVLIAAELDGCRMLGRLACTAPRFWRKSVADPTHKGEGAPELWSVAEEGARRRLRAQSEQVRGWVSRETSGGSWLRALGKAEKLMAPLRFTARWADIELSESGAFHDSVTVLGSVWLTLRACSRSHRRDRRRHSRGHRHAERGVRRRARDDGGGALRPLRDAEAGPGLRGRGGAGLRSGGRQ